MPLSIKVDMTKKRIKEWVDTYGIDGVYVSFSGGKDSTVLLNIAREIYPEMLGVFIDTGLEYPEIRQFVKSYENVQWLKPKLTFKQVIEKYGYPFISKEVGECVDGAKKYLTDVMESGILSQAKPSQAKPSQAKPSQAKPSQAKPRRYGYYFEKLTGTGRYSKPNQSESGGGTPGIVNYEELASLLNTRMLQKLGGRTKD